MLPYNDLPVDLFESDLNNLNIKDPDTLYFRIKNNLQALIDVYSIYTPFSDDIPKLNNILNEVYELHENCNLDVQEDYDWNE